MIRREIPILVIIIESQADLITRTCYKTHNKILTLVDRDLVGLVLLLLLLDREFDLLRG